MNLLYLACRTRSVTVTVMVLSIDAEVTTPSRTLRALRVASSVVAVSVEVVSVASLMAHSALGLGRRDLALADEGVDACDLTPHLLDLGGVLELTRRVPEAQVERLVLGLAELVDELGQVHPVELVLLGHLRSSPHG